MVYIYVDNKEIRRDSGITEGSVRLGNLTTSNVIKISYTKNANTVAGRDNIIFSVTKGQGESTKVKSCDTGRQNGIGLSGSTGSLNLNDADYYYASSYTYTDSGFTLSNDATLARWSDETYKDLIGKYACDNKGMTCSTLHYVQSYNSNRQGGTSKYTIAPKRSYTKIGTTNYNEHCTSMSSVGYMYNTNYKYKTKGTSRETILTSFTFNANYYYGVNAVWNSTTNKYEMTDVSKESTIDAAVGKYTFKKNSNPNYSDNNLLYIVGFAETYNSFIIQLTDEGSHDLEYFNTAYTYGDSITEINGKYQINNPSIIYKTDWLS